MPNPPLLGASRDEIARIIGVIPTQGELSAAAHRWCCEKDRETSYDDVRYFHANWWALPGLQALVEAEIRKRPEFAGLLTPSLSHEEEVENGQWTEPRRGPSEDARPESPSGMGPSDLDAGRSAEGAGGFTPGPWLLWGPTTVARKPAGRFFNTEDALATVCQRGDWHANARLIAAAPDLLEACREARDFLSATHQNLTNGEWSDYGAMELDAQLADAIAKATGQTTPPTPGDKSREEPK